MDIHFTFNGQVFRQVLLVRFQISIYVFKDKIGNALVLSGVDHSKNDEFLLKGKVMDKLLSALGNAFIITGKCKKI